MVFKDFNLFRIKIWSPIVVPPNPGDHGVNKFEYTQP